MIDSIPLKIEISEQGAILPKVFVEIDNEKREFLLDSGARSSYIEKDSFTSRYKSIGRGKSTGASGISIPCDYIVIDQLKFGRFILKQQKMKRCDKANLIGLDILGEFIFQLDLANKKLNILDELSKGESFSIKRLDTGHITMPFKIEETKTFGLFDSGADTTVIDAKFVKENQNLFTLVRDEEGTDANGNKIPSQIYSVKEIRIGGTLLKNIEMATFEFGDHLRSKMEGTPIIMGNNIIGKFKWSFDLKSGLWQLEN